MKPVSAIWRRHKNQIQNNGKAAEILRRAPTGKETDAGACKWKLCK